MSTLEEFPDTPTIADMGPVHIVPIGKVTASVGNPRKITDKAVSMVMKSIAEFGWQQPIVVDKDYVVIAGHTRLKAAARLNLQRVPVTIADKLTEQQVKAYRIADNRAGDFTSWDFPELTQQLEELSDEFADVLGLADWQAVVSEFNDMEAEALGLDADDEVESYLSGEFQLTVVCANEADARTVSAALIDMDGVVDVRDKR